MMVLVATSATSQTLTMGNAPSVPNSSDAPIATTRTAVDLTNPANATGSLTHVAIGWSSSGCTAALKVKVFRRVGDNFTLVAERGPYNTGSDGVVFDLQPPIAVMEGDVIGTARVANCGNPVVYNPSGIVLHASYLEIAGDVSSFSYSPSAEYPGQLAAAGTGDATEVVAGVITSVASNPGRLSSYYHTLVQMLALPFSGRLTGRFVFHPKLVPGSPLDASMSFSISGGDVQSWADVLTSMNATGQPGSLDIVVPWGQQMPLIGAQVYNDQGANGTSGFREEPVATTNHGFSVNTSVVFPGATAFLFGPADAARYRSNLAVRSLEAGVTGTVQAFHADGSAAGSMVTFRYGPNTWDQKSWADFTGAALVGGDYLSISVYQGAAIFDGSIVDNVTNDPADTLARVAYAIE
jgi:hypothetical protein